MDVHRAIQRGETTCNGIVQAYIERARAYNGSCTQLVTRDGASIAARAGAVRAGSATSFPSSTTAIGSVLPGFDEYAGPPIDFGRLEATISDPTVYQQYGMVVGIHNAGQINALSTLNIRGERSVSCKALCDAPPASGPIPASCPKACDDFRKQPDALEYAAALDAKYGRHPDLKAMPMYCVAFSFKDVYDTARETGGSSSGSAASVAANLVHCSICEETGGSCRQPAWRNDVVALVTTKGLIPYGGAIGADPYLDRAGIQCRTVQDAARVLDALKDPGRGYFDPRDIYTALPKGLIAQKPYASFADTAGTGIKTGKTLAGTRIGIVREYMVKHAANDAAMSDQVNAEIKKVLRDRLGAELVESFDPMYLDDPSIPNMTYNFQQALAEILPFHMPEYLQRPGRDATLPYAVPGADVTRRDYMVKVGEGQAPWPDKLNIRSVNNGPPSASFAFNFAQYLLRRGDARVRDWASLNANATYYSATRVAAMKNWENKVDLASDGITQNIKMREVMRLVILKVMRQNNIDVFVNPTTTIPPARIGYASQPAVNDRPVGRFPTSANVGIPEIAVPAGFNPIVYEPEYVLNTARNNYAAAANDDRRSTLELPLPVGISFWAGPGDEGVVIKVAAAYEAATRHRTAPPTFGAVSHKKGER